jgi:methylated-DNA-[protein]-cysteine S-methyltransferase
MSIQLQDDLRASFAERCYTFLRQIPEGRVTSYKELAKALNCKAYRAVGSAMAKNTDLITTPCHRVVKSNGQIGGYALGTAAKIILLEKEGIKIINEKVKDFDDLLFRFDT